MIYIYQSILFSDVVILVVAKKRKQGYFWTLLKFLSETIMWNTCEKLHLEISY